MAADLFSGARAPSPVQSEAGDGFVAGGGPRTGRGAPVGSKGLFRTDNTQGKALKGGSGRSVDSRKFRYDVVRGIGANVPFETTRDDRMSADEAGRMLHSIHTKYGIETETEGILTAFDRGMFFCHTVNGGSTLNPGRSSFSVPGILNPVSFGDIRDILGIDMRRFFRAFADDITAVNKRVLEDYNPHDMVSSEHWGWLVEVATARGLQRFPYLSHDSADACIFLSSPERAALSASKTMVISSSDNSADRYKANDRVKSADAYNSQVGAST